MSDHGSEIAIKTFNATLAQDVVLIVNQSISGWPYVRTINLDLIQHWREAKIIQPEHMLLAYRNGKPKAFLHGIQRDDAHFINLLALVPDAVEEACLLLAYAETQARANRAVWLHGPEWSSGYCYGGFLLGSDFYLPHFSVQATEVFVRSGFLISSSEVLMIRDSAVLIPVRPAPDGYVLDETPIENEYGAETFRFAARFDGNEVADCTARLYPLLLDPQGRPVGYIAPVATQEAHRSKGLAKALVLASLQRLAELGAGDVLLGVRLDNVPALKVYEGVGFQRRYNINGWSKQLAKEETERTKYQKSLVLLSSSDSVAPDSAQFWLEKLQKSMQEMEEHLQSGLIPFWKERGWDSEYGGYHTTYDEKGSLVDDPQRFLYTHCRQLWWFAHVYRTQAKDPDSRRLVELGLDYLLKEFQRDRPGTWHWKRQRGGGVTDSDCVLYGYSFVIYALSECYLALNDERALHAACETFDFIQSHFADGRHGGYYEFLESDYSLTQSAAAWFDRKSLDGHLHLMEALTSLSSISTKEIHQRRLSEIIDIICQRMVDPQSGSGRNQLDLAYQPVQPISIHKMWDPKARKTALTGPVDLTSYGHNAETAWLLNRAIAEAHHPPDAYLPVTRGLLDHTLANGIDWEFGGIYRYGRFSGPPTLDDKDFWPQAEGMIGFLDGYRLFGKPKYLEAFENIWGFVKKHLIVSGVGEWRSLVNRRGEALDAYTGQPWKDGYHTGRSLSECIRLAKSILT
jgi:cellobiose epimerase